MRIAWLGPIGQGGVPGLGRVLLDAFAYPEDDIDLYLDDEYFRSRADELRDILKTVAGYAEP